MFAAPALSISYRAGFPPLVAAKAMTGYAASHRVRTTRSVILRSIVDARRLSFRFRRPFEKTAYVLRT